MIIYWNLLFDTLFSTDTLGARDELLEGFNKSFWGSNSLTVYLFGRGTNKLSEDITKTVTWDSRSDIENGYAMILHMYGFVGIACYLTSSIAFILKLISLRYFYEVFIAIFFLFFSPYITQEYVATTFYIILGVMIYMYKFKYAAGNFEFNEKAEA